MTKHFYDIICLQQMLCKYKAYKTHLNYLVIIGGVRGVKYAVADKLQKIKT